MKKIDAMVIAEWFLWYNKINQDNQILDACDVYEGLTHLKIQKMLYYAEGVYLAMENKSLFDNKIYAWTHGPVIKEVYEKLKIYGKNEIEFDENYWNIISEINRNASLFGILQSVYDNYGGYTAWQLREKTHAVGGPWQITVDTKGMNKEISKKLIKDYFIKNIVRTYEE